MGTVDNIEKSRRPDSSTVVYNLRPLINNDVPIERAIRRALADCTGFDVESIPDLPEPMGEGLDMWLTGNVSERLSNSFFGTTWLDRYTLTISSDLMLTIKDSEGLEDVGVGARHIFPDTADD